VNPSSRRLLDLHHAGVITRRELEILELRYTHGLSQRTTALALGMGRTTVRDLEKRGLNKIRSHETKEAA
jgi:DNA-directed RNA polymerase specialized sigma subunit